MLTEIKSPSCKPEMWGGLECTISRTGDHFRDQLGEAGHYIRADDIDHFAAMGLSRIRYPVLWEHHQPQEDGTIDWSWITKQLNTLQQKNVIPIAGLLHHGSGPLGTSLLDPLFPEKLADYAGSVALQFPWLEFYTPINEPLTTARFSGLYGCWYPHHSNDYSFLKMLLIQLRAIVLSMQAIRKINPLAKLVQTEDLSKTHSTYSLAYQAEFENHRRWLTYDLLTGRVTPAHPLWNYFITSGITTAELDFFTENICSPDIAGFNYYVTSERFLDETPHIYPAHAYGGNNGHSYADTEAVRNGKMDGLETLLLEAWQRFQLPMAVTECHINCTREEQVRWLKQTWDTACTLNEEGIPVIAVTAWSLLGAFDWNSLLTQRHQQYEAGVFDISNGRLRATLLEKMLRDLATTGQFKHPLASQPGWWARKRNSITPAQDQNCILLVAPKKNTIIEIFSKTCSRRNIKHRLFVIDEDSILTLQQLSTMFAKYQPWAVICLEDGAATMPAVIHTDSQPGSIQVLLASICERLALPLMCVNTTTVVPYSDDDKVLSVAAGASGMVDADKALDIFIDGEKGCWFVDAQGVCSAADADMIMDQQHHS